MAMDSDLLLFVWICLFTQLFFTVSSILRLCDLSGFRQFAFWLVLFDFATTYYYNESFATEFGPYGYNRITLKACLAFALFKTALYLNIENVTKNFNPNVGNILHWVLHGQKFAIAPEESLPPWSNAAGVSLLSADALLVNFMLIYSLTADASCAASLTLCLFLIGAAIALKLEISNHDMAKRPLKSILKRPILKPKKSVRWHPEVKKGEETEGRGRKLERRTRRDEKKDEDNVAEGIVVLDEDSSGQIAVAEPLVTVLSEPPSIVDIARPEVDPDWETCF